MSPWSRAAALRDVAAELGELGAIQELRIEPHRRQVVVQLDTDEAVQARPEGDAAQQFPGETSCLTLVWAVLDLFFSHASNGATFTQHLYRIKYQPAESATVDEEVTVA